MFTGIIDHTGTVEWTESHVSGMRIGIHTTFTELAEGESIAIDGCCLTICHPTKNTFVCDLSPETLGLTIAGRYEKGRKVNLERALRMGDRLGGHWVTGHIDGKGRVAMVQNCGEFVQVQIKNLSPILTSYLLKKGSIAVNGVSLTINEVKDNAFELMLIPHTLEVTSLGSLRENEEVNLEMDWMLKAVWQACSERLSLIKELNHGN